MRTFLLSIATIEWSRAQEALQYAIGICSGVGNCTSRLSWSSVRHGPRGTRLRRRCLLFGKARSGLPVQRAVRRPRGLSGRVSGQIEISLRPCCHDLRCRHTTMLWSIIILTNTHTLLLKIIETLKSNLPECS